MTAGFERLCPTAGGVTLTEKMESRRSCAVRAMSTSAIAGAEPRARLVSAAVT
jgi:hypothetical protein